MGKIIGAFMADKTNIRLVYSIGTLLTFLLLIPLFVGIVNTHSVDIEIFYILLFLISFANGPTDILSVLQLAKRYPLKYRYTLVSGAYALSALFFIGLPPFIFSYFTRESSMYYPILVLGIGYIVQLIAVQLFYKKTEQLVST